MTKTATLYSLPLICQRCRVVDTLTERICQERGIKLEKKTMIQSMIYLLLNGYKPPVLLIDGHPVSHGRVVSEMELLEWL